jgi:hypothetical protein
VTRTPSPHARALTAGGAELDVLTPREASMFACLTDTFVAPKSVLPPVAATDAARAFDRWLCEAPRLNAVGMRALVIVAELGPLALGHGRRLRRLPAPDRARYLEALERSPVPLVRQLTRALKSVAFLCYYGDDGLLLRLGYDPTANVRRGRELRARDGRP